MKFQSVRGTHDLIADDALRFRKIEALAWQIAQRFGYEELKTPIFEFAEVFARSVGESSDIVSKEMYAFEDRGGELLCLRPEGTAGICRAFVQHGLQQKLPLRYFYSGPMFRYERPQKGRQRQFHQIGVECLGIAEARADIECMDLAYQFLNELELKNLQLEINSLGDKESRAKYRDLLVGFLDKYKNDLSEDSQKRLQTNPLRILDSKDEGDQKILVDAPEIKASMNEESIRFYQETLNGLAKLGIPFQENQKLVRGLDYYCHAVFEFTSSDLGAQSAVLAGGRYDGLVELLGGKPTPGIGWAAGIERLALLVENKLQLKKQKLYGIIAMGETEKEIDKLASDLRKKGLHITTDCQHKNLGKAFKKADKAGVKVCILLGEEEWQAGKVSVKNLETGEQKSIELSDLQTDLSSSESSTS